MGLKKTTQQCTTWIAMFAILVSFFSHGVAYALLPHTSNVTPLSEICTALVTKKVGNKAASASATQSPASSDHSTGPHQHCAFCSSSVPPLNLSCIQVFIFRIATSHPHVPDFFYGSLTSLFIWVTAPSRAPPFMT